MSTASDFTTENLIVKAAERYSMAYGDIRALHGSSDGVWLNAVAHPITNEARFGRDWYAAYRAELAKVSGGV